MPPYLSIHELYSAQKKKVESRTVYFDQIIELIHRRIKKISSVGGLNTFYEVPGILIGYPLYDLNECTTYIINALRKNGFLVQLLPPPNNYAIYISWNPSEINVKQDKLPSSSKKKHFHLF